MELDKHDEAMMEAVDAMLEVVDGCWKEEGPVKALDTLIAGISTAMQIVARAGGEDPSRLLSEMRATLDRTFATFEEDD